MQKGTIATLTDKGFGFLKVEGMEKDLFFHSKDLVEGLAFDSLKQGDEMTFEVSEGPKGAFAANVARA